MGSIGFRISRFVEDLRFRSGKGFGGLGAPRFRV